MLNCRRSTALQSQARDGQLTFFEKLWLKFHLLLCSACRRFGIQLDILGNLTRELENCDTEENDKLSSEERENLKQKIRQADSHDPEL